jgi:hypothetical protein
MHAGCHRVELDVASGDEQLAVVPHELAPEAAPEQVAANTVPVVSPARVATDQLLHRLRHIAGSDADE